MESSLYGPALPPGFKKSVEESSSSPEREEDEASTSRLPIIIGPQLPPHLTELKEAEDTCNKNTQEGSMSVIGPALPLSFSQNEGEVESDYDSDSDSVYGPLPADNNSESVDNVVASIEKRATEMKKKLQGIDKPVDDVAKREEWMSLPATDYKNQFGIISRCLVGGEQQSSKKRPASILSEEAKHSVKNEKLKEELEKYNKAKRSESLLELHRKSKKQKRDKDSEKPKERKAFDRDAELGIRLMDQRQVNSVIRNSKKLNSRFSAGASQYL